VNAKPEVKLSHADFDVVRNLLQPVPASSTRRPGDVADLGGHRLGFRPPVTIRRTTHQQRVTQWIPAAAPMPATRVDRDRREGARAIRGVVNALVITGVGLVATVVIGYGVGLYGLANGWW
jgi:hypothetical protein